MEYGIVIHKKSLNYGDDIQSLAATKLLPTVNHFIDREQLDKFENTDTVKTICNGWFMENPYNWPPALSIDPLFISMHITHNNDSVKYLLDRTHFEYYKKYEPIGCRDLHTMNLFQKFGIKAYYSGCLTLTLENNYANNSKSEEIIFVDAINKYMPEDYRQLCLNKLIPDSIRKQVVFIKQSHENANLSVEERLTHAESLLERYSRAHLVVTSRIHCALPCIALGTPVLFLDVGFNRNNSRNRFKGIIEYFNRIDNSAFPYSSNKLLSLLFRKLHLYNLHFDSRKIDFNWEKPPANPVDIQDIKEHIKSKVRDFINQ